MSFAAGNYTVLFFHWYFKGIHIQGSFLNWNPFPCLFLLFYSAQSDRTLPYWHFCRVSWLFRN